MACWPWLVTHRHQGIQLEHYPDLERWYETLKQRPALRHGYDVGKDLRKLTAAGPDEIARNILFGPADAGGDSA